MPLPSLTETSRIMLISAVVQAKQALPASLWVHRKDNDLSLRTVRQQARGSVDENEREKERGTEVVRSCRALYIH